MLWLILKINSVVGKISSVIGKVLIPWDDQYCQTWDELSTMEWQNWNTAPCDKIWAKLSDNKWENETTTWENLKD